MKYHFTRPGTNEEVVVNNGPAVYLLFAIFGILGLIIVVPVSFAKGQQRMIASFYANFFILALIVVLGVKIFPSDQIVLIMGGIAVVIMMVMYFLYLKNINKWQMKSLVDKGYILKSESGYKPKKGYISLEVMRANIKDIKIPKYVWYK